MVAGITSEIIVAAAAAAAAGAASAVDRFDMRGMGLGILRMQLLEVVITKRTGIHAAG